MWNVFKKLVVVFVILGGTAFIAGCGNGTNSQVFGFNSDILVSLTSSDIADLELIATEQQGGPDVVDSCREHQSAFGCRQELLPLETRYFFKTNSTASLSPYFVYVRNNTGTTRRFLLEIFVDGKSKYREATDIFANETIHMAKVLRNSVNQP